VTESFVIWNTYRNSLLTSPCFTIELTQLCG